MPTEVVVSVIAKLNFFVLSRVYVNGASIACNKARRGCIVIKYDM